MLRTTPFHERVSALNQTSLWSHWSGHLVADKYQMSEKFEYFAVRNAAGAFDTSPLHKYRIHGGGAEHFLAGVLVRDIRTCPPGRGQYTIWCDDRGYVEEDGVILRLGDDEFFLTTAKANLSYLERRAGAADVAIDDVTDDYASVALQGPRSRIILGSLAPEIDALGHFEHTSARIADMAVTVSRTGFTGDLGYEVHVDADCALDVWDAIFAAGHDHGLVPFGQTALLMARIEAGLLLIDVDFESSRLAENDAHRSTPSELGLGWMLKGIAGDRSFIGRDAIRRELADGTSRWSTVGLVVDWADFDRRYRDAGLVPPKDHTPIHDEMIVYRSGGRRVGYATSFMYSPVLQRHIALARIRPDLAVPGTSVDLEFTIDHRYRRVGAHVARLPLYDPPRRTS